MMNPVQYENYKNSNSGHTDSSDLVETNTITIHQYVLNIDEEIESPSMYRQAFSVFQKATEQDVIIIRINSPGGFVSTAVQMINMIQNCRALCIAELYLAYSAASAIALACDEIRVMKYSSMMVHNITLGLYGKVNEIASHGNFINDWGSNFLRKVYNGFLTKGEIDSVLSGMDLWFKEEEIKKRLKAWTPMRKYEQKSTTTP